MDVKTWAGNSIFRCITVPPLTPSPTHDLKHLLYRVYAVEVEWRIEHNWNVTPEWKLFGIARINVILNINKEMDCCDNIWI